MYDRIKQINFPETQVKEVCTNKTKRQHAMTINLFQTAEYRTLMQEHLFKTISYLFDKEAEFALACDIKYVNFNPPLPREIIEGFHDTVLFILSGYTYETATVDGHYLAFEAGFGEENFGSEVTVPLLAIRQIFTGETPILINLAHPAPGIGDPKEKNRLRNTPKKSSMEALLSNPENKKLLKKKK